MCAENKVGFMQILKGLVHISMHFLFQQTFTMSSRLQKSSRHALPHRQGRSKRSGWSGFGRTIISQGKNKVPFYKKQVINKSTRVIFGLI